jgi:SAM-dependent methyltransferase
MQDTSKEPFDIEQVTPLRFSCENKYLDFTEQNYFDVCRGSSVLEIGPCEGKHTARILSQNPKYFEIIEGNKTTADILLQNKNIDRIVVDDVMLALTEKKSFDVVICLGVLYHLHSSLHLLELIVNNCNPKTLILDCVRAPSALEFLPEPSNLIGQNQTRQGWRSCDFNLVTPFLTYYDSMANLGYKMKQVHQIRVDNYFSKSNSWMASWKIDEVQERN